eukprot:CAMPEP_0118869632 /NCGR_PEP_ID=MMETSP1163-20130328/12908_1 /TAXON_ID=124430 /ORGANISM="Phaeomonas parva, Strain CCMP2877" /LENGTH=93 /DNA_ID=CAMNT_0006804547 /DNA_START=11 /DNA_END=289 /DNA_ORIENTATION=+
MYLGKSGSGSQSAPASRESSRPPLSRRGEEPVPETPAFGDAMNEATATSPRRHSFRARRSHVLTMRDAFERKIGVMSSESSPDLRSFERRASE